MEDKFLMENILYASKVLNDLYMHGVIESSNEEVASLFNKLSSDTLKMHNEIYKAMEEEGFYKVTNATEAKIKQTQDKLSCACNECECDDCECDEEE
jgi:spore coat protein CotF